MAYEGGGDKKANLCGYRCAAVCSVSALYGRG